MITWWEWTLLGVVLWALIICLFIAVWAALPRVEYIDYERARYERMLDKWLKEVSARRTQSARPPAHLG